MVSQVLFENFLQDMGPRPKPKGAYPILRINDALDYTPANCIWMRRELIKRKKAATASKFRAIA